MVSLNRLERGFAAMPNPSDRRGLFEPFDKAQDRLREFPSRMIRHCGEGTRRAVHRRTWFWVLLPKPKSLS